MNQRTMVFANIALIVVSLLIGIFLYPALPAEIASHWNAAGVADGMLPKFWGVFLLPMLMIVVLGLSQLLPLLDPMRANVESFRRSYQNFFFWIGVFLFYIFLLTVAWALGWRFNFTLALIPALAALFFVIGSLLAHSKRNWFIGIRTPWTMQSEEVWDKTNQLGGLLFKICAGLMLLGLVLPQYLIYFILLPVGATVVATIAYSYIEFRRQKV